MPTAAVVTLFDPRAPKELAPLAHLPMVQSDLEHVRLLRVAVALRLAQQQIRPIVNQPFAENWQQFLPMHRPVAVIVESWKRLPAATSSPVCTPLADMLATPNHDPEEDVDS